MPSIFKKITNTVISRIVKESLDRIFGGKSKNTKTKRPSSSEGPDKVSIKNHPWRLCPIGQHWVQTHPMTVPASSKSPPRETIRRGHCRTNTGKSEVYTADELREIAEEHFDKLLDDPIAMPISDTLGFPNGNKYDLLIAGWAKFWNEILKPEEPLTPDFVKALIATESSFNVPKDQSSKSGYARGLIQVTEQTRQILQNPSGELNGHHIEMSINESREPVTNIAAGVRWLHYKKWRGERRLKRKLTWDEAAAEYKGILEDIGKDDTTDRIMKDLRYYHKCLKDHRK